MRRGLLGHWALGAPGAAGVLALVAPGAAGALLGQTGCKKLLSVTLCPLGSRAGERALFWAMEGLPITSNLKGPAMRLP